MSQRDSKTTTQFDRAVAMCASCGRKFLSLGWRGDMIDHYQPEGSVKGMVAGRVNPECGGGS